MSAELIKKIDELNSKIAKLNQERNKAVATKEVWQERLGTSVSDYKEKFGVDLTKNGESLNAVEPLISSEYTRVLNETQKDFDKQSKLVSLVESGNVEGAWELLGGNPNAKVEAVEEPVEVEDPLQEVQEQTEINLNNWTTNEEPVDEGVALGNWAVEEKLIEEKPLEETKPASTLFGLDLGQADAEVVNESKQEAVKGVQEPVKASSLFSGLNIEEEEDEFIVASQEEDVADDDDDDFVFDPKAAPADKKIDWNPQVSEEERKEKQEKEQNLFSNFGNILSGTDFK
jgi:hypothetical protein